MGDFRFARGLRRSYVSNVMPRSLVDYYQRFTRNPCLHLQGGSYSFLPHTLLHLFVSDTCHTLLLYLCIRSLTYEFILILSIFSTSVHSPPYTSLFSYVYLAPLTSSLRISHVLVPPCPLDGLEPRSLFHSSLFHTYFSPPSAYSSVLNMEAASFFETSVMIYQATQRHITEGSNVALGVTLTLFLETSPAVSRDNVPPGIPQEGSS